MAHVIEPALSGRAKCRGCGERIAKRALRLGERLPNILRQREMTLWFHLPCAAYKRPGPFLEALQATTETIGDVAGLEHAARRALAHPRLPRIDGAERTSSSRAHCRHCRGLIERGGWRIRRGSMTRKAVSSHLVTCICGARRTTSRPQT